MKSLSLNSFQQRLNNNFLGKVANAYLLILLLTLFIGVLSIAAGNFVTRQLSMNINDSLEFAEGESSSEVLIKRGDTLGRIFKRQEISVNEAEKVISAIKASNISYILKPGQKIYFDYDVIENDNEDITNYALKGVTIHLDRLKRIVVNKIGQEFVATEIAVQLKKILVSNEVEIKTTFIDALKRLGVSFSNIQELISAYSYQIDFQRQIKPGNKISFVLEKFYDEQGKEIYNGKVMFSSLKLADGECNIYYYKQNSNDKGSYYSSQGKSIKSNLLRTPVNVTRISSHFGKRNHPVLGFTQMHKGVDFSAPMGTPILAAGDGVITDIGYKGAYGKFIQVKHSSNLSTAYAHAKDYAKNISIGSRVKQGQVIAYVGNTGRTTGSHLHYEVRINGKHVNPLSVLTTPGVELKGKSLVHFSEYKNKIHELLSKKSGDNQIELSDFTL